MQELIIALLGWMLAWVTAALSPRRIARRQTPIHKDKDRQSVPDTRVSVMIPARNEAMRLPSLLAALAARPETWEVIVADDGSEDETAQVATSYGAQVVRVPPLPPGWTGKSWALWNATRASHQESTWYMFLDADVRVTADTLSTLLATHRSDVAWTIQPWHTTRHIYEQCSLFFNILVWLGTNRTASQQHGGFGPALVVSRAQYDKVGGHGAIREVLLEHSEFAKRLAESGTRVRNLIGATSFSFRMYEGGLSDLVRGWQKHFAVGASRTPIWRLLLTILWLCGAGAAVSSVWESGVSGVPSAIFISVLVYLLYVFQIFALGRMVGRFHLVTALAFPIPLLAFFIIFIGSLARKRGFVTWRGRRVRVK